ncbi:MAG: ATP-binding protein [Paracoccaceae bacterium]
MTLLAPIKARSLRRDLALGLSLGVAAAWLLALLAAGYFANEEMEEVFDSGLQETAERILPLAVIELINAEEGRPARRVSPVGPHEEYITYAVHGPDGAVLLYSHDADLATFSKTPTEGFHTTDNHRIFGLAAVSGAYLIEVAEPLDHRQEAIMGTLGTLLVPLLFLLPLSLLGITWFTRSRLRPVAALSNEVRQRDASDLSPLNTRGLQAEFLPIRDAVNRLMARMARTLEAERSFTSNAAHELRTPVAATLVQTQRLIAEAPDGPLRRRAEAIEAELKRLTRLAEKLLQLSRAEGSGVQSETLHDISPILAMVVEDFNRAGFGPRLKLALPDGAALSRIDADAFAILARNLIENALTHGDPAQAVSVVLERNGQLIVTNAGKPVPPEVLARLTTRFERAGSRASGSGLGLAIATSIAKGAGAELRLTSPAPGRADGFEAAFIPA